MPPTTRSIVFHYPRPVQERPTVGSEIHPTRMLEGFRAIGYDVDVVDGFGKDRKRAIRRVVGRLAAGHSYDFVFSEASTTPTALNDPHHLPLHPIMDWRFLAGFARRGIPVGLFYPDVHWQFPFYDALTTRTRAFVAKRFYRYDLWWYRRVLSALFLPSVPMAKWIPGWEQDDRVCALAPGGVGVPLPLADGDHPLRLFYVGSVVPPIYDIGPLVEAVLDVDDVELTICCPSEHRDRLPLDRFADRIRVVHESGDAVRDRYAACDVACLVYGPEPYRSFAMPVKLFEAIGLGRPVIVSDGSTAADFVRESGLGWVTSNDDLAELLVRLRDARTDLRDVQSRVAETATAQSWECRAEYVGAELLRRRLEPRR